MCETWLPFEPTLSHSLSSYQFVFSNAVKEKSLGRASGGLAIAADKMFSIETLDKSTWWIFILVKFGSFMLIICNVYFKPSLNIDEILELFQISLLQTLISALLSLAVISIAEWVTLTFVGGLIWISI